MCKLDSHRDQVKRAGGNDLADWSEKITKGAYLPGTRFTINGVPFNPATADEILAGDTVDDAPSPG